MTILEMQRLQDVVPQSFPVLLGVLFIGVFVSDLIGNNIEFKSKIQNALTTAGIATALLFLALFLLDAISSELLLKIAFFALVFIGVFVADLIGNTITFQNAVANALVTSAIAVGLVYVLVMFLYGGEVGV